jgi:hypothetical protein
MDTPDSIRGDPRFFPFFQDCIGALDGCHCDAFTNDLLFRNRKKTVSQNVLGVVNFDSTFSYVLAGWEGSAHDGNVLQDALMKGLIRREGKFYIADAGTENIFKFYFYFHFHFFYFSFLFLDV